MAEESVTVSGFEQGTLEYLIAEKAKIYLGEEPPALAVDFSIEKYKQTRNYPHSYTQEQMDDDLNGHLSTIVMAVVDLVAKVGGEGETGHTDSGTVRQYENAYISLSLFSDVIPFVDTPF